jgi:L-ascorbate metabolism protein UlaG (beta-lactamase superfamily)
VRILRYLYQDTGRPIARAPHRPRPAEWKDDAITAAWLGHATVLLNFYGVVILTDPVFFARIGLRFGPLTFGPKRYVACALRPEELPPIDLVLLSHAHMDHFDLRSLQRLPRGRSIAVTARGTADLLSRRRFREIHEVDWQSSIKVETPHGEVGVTAFQMRHWGSRLPWETHRAYNAYVLERNGRRVCFAGDTARIDASQLGSRGPLDLMIVPIGAYNPWIHNHCTPEEAVAMADEAGACYLLPVHYETFKLSHEPMDEPIRRLRAALAGEPERLALTQVGETFTVPSGAPRERADVEAALPSNRKL